MSHGACAGHTTRRRQVLDAIEGVCLIEDNVGREVGIEILFWEET